MTPALRLDCRGLYCPVPILRTAEGIGRLADGEELELLADDPGVTGDLDAWCRGTGHELVSLSAAGGLITGLVRKRSRRRPS